MSRQVNIFEETVKDLIDRTTGLRFDICRCDLCKKAMKEMVLKNLPVFFVNPDHFRYEEIIKRVNNTYFKRIMQETIKAIAYVSKNPPHKIEEDHEAGFNQLLERIYQDRGLDFSRYHRNILKRRVALRLRARNLNSYREYLSVLAADPDEYKKLFDVLTINVSEFFRDLTVWGAIREILSRKILRENQTTKVKIWSAGCAKGEEAYSLSILVEEIGPKTPVEIYATDIDVASIYDAQKGEYDPHRLKNVSDILLEKYFEFQGEGRYSVKEHVKKRVTFKRQDLINDNFLPEMDLILCRNVFIYFTKPLQETILNKFYHSLKDDGYLVIGKSETIISEAKLIFKEIDIDNRVYQKKKVKDKY